LTYNQFTIQRIGVYFLWYTV